MRVSRYFLPGYVEVIAGPMGMSKTTTLIQKLQKLRYIDNKLRYVLFDPKENKRSRTHVAARFNGEKVEMLPCVKLAGSDPWEILDLAKDAEGKMADVIAIDEAQFFSKELVNVIFHLARKAKCYVLVAGLDLDYRGEPFGPMGELLARADIRTNLEFPICQFPNCVNDATRTQMLNEKDEAVPWTENGIVATGTDVKYKYQARCPHHHIVPGNPHGMV